MLAVLLFNAMTLDLSLLLYGTDSQHTHAWYRDAG